MSFNSINKKKKKNIWEVHVIKTCAFTQKKKKKHVLLICQEIDVNLICGL
jgi:hypothetical protein